MKWKSFEVEYPNIESGLISEDILFIFEENIYFGYYHDNGCVYGSNSQQHEFAGHTNHALTKYLLSQLPSNKIEKWIYIKDLGLE